MGGSLSGSHNRFEPPLLPSFLSSLMLPNLPSPLHKLTPFPPSYVLSPQVLLRLDTSRNELLVANAAFALLASCIGIGTFLTAIFGMNLDNTVTIMPYFGVFEIVWAGSTFCMIASFVAVYAWLDYAKIFPRRIVINKELPVPVLSY